ncbi:hypothetical protein MTO96_043997 [Rhipicephalus appendiculatus]
MGPQLPRTSVRPRPTKTAPGRPRPRTQPRLLYPGRRSSPGLVLGPWMGHWNWTLNRPTGTAPWTGTSLSNARLRNPGAEARLRLSSSLPPVSYPHVPPELVPSFPPLFPLFSSRLRAACPPLVFISFGFHFRDAFKSLTFTTHVSHTPLLCPLLTLVIVLGTAGGDKRTVFDDESPACGEP